MMCGKQVLEKCAGIPVTRLEQARKSHWAERANGIGREAKGETDSVVLAQAHSESNLLEEEKMADMCVPPLVICDVSSVPYLEQKSKEKLLRKIRDFKTGK